MVGEKSLLKERKRQRETEIDIGKHKEKTDERSKET